MQCRVTGFFKFSTVRYGTGLVTIICIPDIDASSTSSGSLSIPSSNNKNDDNQHHLTTKPVIKVTWRNRKQEECDPDFRRSRHPVMIPMGIAASPVAPMGYGGQQQHPHVATSAMVIPHMMTSHHHQIPVGYHGNTLANTQTNVTTAVLPSNEQQQSYAVNTTVKNSNTAGRTANNKSGTNYHHQQQQHHAPVIIIT